MLILLRKKFFFKNLNREKKKFNYLLSFFEKNIFQILFFKSFIFLLFNNYKNLNILKFFFFYLYNFIYLYYLILNIDLNFKFLKKNFLFNLINFEFNYLKKLKLKKNILSFNFFFKTQIFNFYNIYLYDKLLYKINNILKKNKKSKKFNYKNIMFKNDYLNKILEIKRISHTKEQGRIRKFKIIFIFGNKTGWLGLGIGSSVTISSAILKAKTRSFKNIKYLKLTKSKTIPNYIFSKFKTTIIILKPLYLWGGLKSPIYIKSLFSILGCKNIWITIIGSSNKLNVLNSFFLGIENFLFKREFFNINFLFDNKIENNLDFRSLLNLLINFI